MGPFEATQILSEVGYSVFLFKDGNRALLHSKKKKKKQTGRITCIQCSVFPSKKSFLLGLSEERLKNSSLNNNNVDSSRPNFIPSTRNWIEDKNLSLSDVDNLFRSRDKDSIGFNNDRAQEDHGFTRNFPPSIEDLDDNLRRLWPEKIDCGEKECVEGSPWDWREPLDRGEKQYIEGSIPHWQETFDRGEKECIEGSTLHWRELFSRDEKECFEGSTTHWWEQFDQDEREWIEQSTPNHWKQSDGGEREHTQVSTSDYWKQSSKGEKKECNNASVSHYGQQMNRDDKKECIEASTLQYQEQTIRSEKKTCNEACMSHYQEQIGKVEKEECIEKTTSHGSSVAEFPSFVSPKSFHGFSSQCDDETKPKTVSSHLQDDWTILESEALGKFFLDKDDGITVTQVLGKEWVQSSNFSEKLGSDPSKKRTLNLCKFRVSIPKEMMKSMPPLPSNDLFPVPDTTPHFHIAAQIVELHDVEHVNLCIDWLLQGNPSIVSLVCKHAGGFLQLIQLSVHDRCVLIKVSLPMAPLAPVVPLKLRDLLSDRETMKVGANIQKDALSIYYFLGATSNGCARISQFVGTKKRKSVLHLCRELFHWDWSENKKVIYSDWGSKVISLEQVKHAVLEAWTTRLVWVGQSQLWHVQSPAFSLVEFPWILLDYFGRSVFSFELQTRNDEVMSVEVKGATVELHGGRLSLKQKNFRSRVMGQNALVELHFRDGRKPQKYVTVYREGSRVVLDDAEAPSVIKRVEDLQEEIDMVSKILVDKTNNHDVQKQKLEESLYMLLCIPGACPRHILAALGCLQDKNMVMQSKSFGLDAACVQSCKMGLNPGQSSAWKYMLSSPLSAVVGPPGTGKTTVISAVTKAWLWLAASGETLVCAAHQNVAVRHMAETMAKERIPGLLMLVSADYYEGWHEDEYSAQKEILVVSGSAQATAESIESWVARNGGQPPRVLLCTLGLIGNDSFHASLMGTRVSAMIIDEGSQAGEGSLIPSLGALPHLQMLSVVGDPCQLPPYGCRQRPIRSVFDLLAQSCEIHVLQEQYRMPYRIAQFVSAEFYGGTLHTDAKKMRQDSDMALMWVDVMGKVEIATSGTSLSNREEAEAIIEWCQARKRHNGGRSMPRGKVVVLTLYEAQRSLISGMLDEQGMGEEIIAYNTDSFQGQEADVVLVSLVVGAWVSSFAADRRRACVLLSRAKHELHLFGNLEAIQGKCSTFKHNTENGNIWTTLAEYCMQHGWVVKRCNLELLAHSFGDI